MAADQLPAEVGEFVTYLNGLQTRLDPSGGWCAVFWRRDPDGMRACLDGREMPPWDVVEALLQDLAAQHGPGSAGPETDRARALHATALAAYDARPGGRDALGDRLDVMLREQKYAAERQAALARRLAAATTREQADALRLDLAWARDDHERAGARCAELRARMACVDGRERGVFPAAWGAAEATHGGAASSPAGDPPGHGTPSAVTGAVGRQDARNGTRHDTRHGAVAPEAGPRHDTRHDPPYGTVAPESRAPSPATVPEQRKRRRGGARFAGMADEVAGPVPVPPSTLPAPAPATAGRTLRGARFAGAVEEAVRRPAREADAGGADDRAQVGRTVEVLARLRGEGRSGEAHALLAEVAAWEPARFPLLAERLRQAGLEADWQTLLWEAAALPAGRLVAAADALVEAGRPADGRQMLRQGTARPPGEVGHAILGLVAEGRHREVRVLLDAYVRARTPEEAARSAEPEPRRLVPLLLEAARGVSNERHWDLVHALRVAGFAV
ncbi:hypothetical protein ADK65_17720 [Streptomyces sp. NRRL B-1140]|uniref:hypothetical protein n=1 Tax=Streptomyces sp. NRRL B-1140 TaxID=1415549 RepID=UPI0006AD8C97|nr:hypothetical protein [Streptomyces sp. NRRL B-1140]KOV99498.1 hypothetical protein ADK65_17720 [Streptomyces sp. NRRL B-1140]